jgi:NADH dehydrogenase
MPVAFIAGATGYTGRVLLEELARGETSWRARPHARKPGAYPDAVVCDPSDAKALAGGMHGCDAVVQLIGTVRKNFADGDYQKVDYGTTVALCEAANSAGVPKIVLLSSVLAGTERGEYLRWKRRTEDQVQRSALRWTIVRPSFIGGPGRRAAGWFLFPLVGWSSSFRPIDVKDLAQLFVRVLDAGEKYDGKILEGASLWDALKG